MRQNGLVKAKLSPIRCPTCKSRFTPKTGWQKYDRPDCRREAFQQREREKMRQEIIAELSAK